MTDNKCFDGETQVHTPYGVCEIEFLEVGSRVLSRCEKTGEQGYRRVIKKFEHQCKESYIVYHVTDKGTDSAIATTAEHPFWVNDIGWVPACELKAGYKLEIVDPIDVTDEYRPDGQKKAQLAMSGGRWQSEVLRVETRDNTFEYAGEICARIVYNIEVEEFHTYFVDWNGVWVHNKDAVILERSTPNNEPIRVKENQKKLQQ